MREGLGTASCTDDWGPTSLDRQSSKSQASGLELGIGGRKRMTEGSFFIIKEAIWEVGGKISIEEQGRELVPGR